MNMKTASGSIETFIKIHSTIPNKFVDDMFELYDTSTTQTDLAVDVDKMATWLGVKKFTIIKTLKHSYRENIDYTIRKIPNPKGLKYGGNTYKQVLLTPDCFKRVCMQSRSKRAEDVRTYFIDIEALVIRYKDQMMSGMETEMKHMASNQKPKNVEDSAGYIYVFRVSKDKDSVYKLGRTKNLLQRLATYRTGVADDDDIDLLYKLRTDSHKTVEACAKLMLKDKQYRKYKEIYQADINLIKLLIHECDAITHKKEQYTRKPKTFKSGGQVKSAGGYYMAIVSE